MFVNYTHQVLCVLPAHVFGANIINYQGEADWSSCMGPQAGGKFALITSFIIQPSTEKLLCQYP